MSENKNVYADGIVVKSKETKFGNVLKVSIKVEDFESFLSRNVDESGWLNLEIVERRQISDKGVTHSVKLDTYKPSQEGNRSTQSSEDSDLPF